MAFTVGLRGQYSNGLRWKLRIARARSATVICMFATTGIILSGRSKGRPRWSTVGCAVQAISEKELTFSGCWRWID